MSSLQPPQAQTGESLDPQLAKERAAMAERVERNSKLALASLGAIAIVATAFSLLYDHMTDEEAPQPVTPAVAEEQINPKKSD